MKKNLLLAFSAMVTVASAQPVIQSTNFMPVGMTFTLSGAGPVSLGSAGANQTWDFSAVTATAAGVLSTVDPSTTPCGSLFPTSNFGEQTPSSSPYLYFLKTSSQIEVMGENWPTNCIGGTNYTDTKIALKFPFNYLDTYSDPYVNTNGSYTCTPTYDAYGTVIMPSGTTYTNVARVSYSDGGKTYTEWFTTGNPAYPLLLAQSTSTIFFSNPVMSVKEASVSLVKVYPNPASANFTVEVPDMDDRQLSVYDVCGKLVLTQSFNGTTSVNTTNLTQGVYYVSVKEQNGVYNQKLIISK